ncbi:zona pellucida sperm-binding protein 1 [Apteryx mantelli]|uniref:Zona pellucida sperm-binding protein 1 n=1 Tax=Apteryx mantelli TaxID=2696672 RepID=A0ABM4EFJ9_9AVES
MGWGWSRYLVALLLLLSPGPGIAFSLLQYRYDCGDYGMQLLAYPTRGRTVRFKVLDEFGTLFEVANCSICLHWLNTGVDGGVIFSSGYEGCHVLVKEDHYILRVRMEEVLISGVIAASYEVNMTCPQTADYSILVDGNMRVEHQGNGIHQTQAGVLVPLPQPQPGLLHHVSQSALALPGHQLPLQTHSDQVHSVAQPHPGLVHPGLQRQPQPSLIRAGVQTQPGQVRPGVQTQSGIVRPGVQAQPPPGLVHPGVQTQHGPARPGVQPQSQPGLVRPLARPQPGLRPGIQSPAQPGLLHPGVQTQPGLVHPGFQPQSQPGLVRPGFQPQSQPGLVHPGLQSQSQPGLVHPGLQSQSQPGLVHPGLQSQSQPGLVHPGLQSQAQPGLVHPGLQSQPQPGLMHPGAQALAGLVRPGIQPQTQPGLARPGLQTHSQAGLIHSGVQTQTGLAHHGLQSQSQPSRVHPGVQTQAGLARPGQSRPSLARPGLHPQSRPGLARPALQPQTQPGLVRPGFHPQAQPGLLRPGLHPQPGLLRPTALFYPSAGAGAQLTREQCHVAAGKIPCTAPQGREACLQVGCCYDDMDRIAPCYYGNTATVQCLLDGHFIIVVPRGLSTQPYNLDSVRLANAEAHCDPVKVTEAFVMFRFPVTQCGTTVQVIEDRLIYENQLISTIDVQSGPQGSITRDSVYILHARCIYNASDLLPVRVEVAVPPTAAPLVEPGPLRLQLRIATDESYSTYHEDSDYPLVKVLRDPIYVEVRLLQKTDPNLVLVLHQCWASPSTSATAEPQWPILVDGCPFVGDNYRTQLVPMGPASPQLPFPSHYQRFVVSTFTFVESPSMAMLEGEVYIFCSASVCHLAQPEPCRPSCQLGVPSRARRSLGDKMTPDPVDTVISQGRIVFQESPKVQKG